MQSCLIITVKDKPGPYRIDFISIEAPNSNFKLIICLEVIIKVHTQFARKKMSVISPNDKKVIFPNICLERHTGVLAVATPGLEMSRIHLHHGRVSCQLETEIA